MTAITSEDAVQLRLYRSISSGGGLIVKVRAIPMVEEYMSGLGNGQRQDIRNYARYWLPQIESDMLQVYQMDTNMGVIETGGVAFRLDTPGNPLNHYDTSPLTGMPRTVANISFLRLVGISKDPGVAFRVKGIFGIDAIKATRASIASAIHAFFEAYVRPVDLRVSVVLTGKE